MTPVRKHKRNLEDLPADGWIICTDTMHLKERGWEGAAQIHFVQERGQWQALLNRVINFNSIHIHSLKNSFTDNTDKCTSIKIYTFTYNPLRLQHVWIFFG